MYSSRRTRRKTGVSGVWDQLAVTFIHFRVVRPPATRAYNRIMEKKIFWIVFTILGLVADFVLPLWLGLVATIPILYISWWVAYRSDWF